MGRSEFWIAVGLILSVGLVGLWWRHHRRRLNLYQAQEAARERIIAACRPALARVAEATAQAGAFRQNLVLGVGGFVEPASLETMRQEALAHLERGVCSYVPTHKKGRTLSYENIHKLAPHCLAFYHSPDVIHWVSRLVGETVFPAAEHDQSACSILYYDRPGDHINWHLDHNFYPGRQFTVLLSLVNRGSVEGLSMSRFEYVNDKNETMSLDTSANSLVIFEGQRVKHRATPTAEGDLRVMLSMTFNTNRRIGWLGELMRRLKDVAFYGPRVLWD